jgi:hypothetical protein
VLRSRISRDDYSSAIEAAIAALDDCLLVIVAPGKMGGHLGFNGQKVLYFEKDGEVAWRIATANEVAELVLSKHGFRQITVIEISAIVAETKAALEFRQMSGWEFSLLIPPADGSQG